MLRPPSRKRLPEYEFVRKKIQDGRNYKTDGAPVDLLLYYDAEDGVEGFKTRGTIPPGLDLDQFYSDQIGAAIRDEGENPYRRIWVYERYRRTVLRRFPQ